MRHTMTRLFCLPYAGGSARVFDGWRRHLPDHVELCPLELPGRGLRSYEKPVGALGALMTDLLDAVLPCAGEPLAIFGHEYGAFLGFELAHRLEHYYRVRARHLFVAAMRAPVWPRARSPISMLSDEGVRDLLGPTWMRPGNEDLMSFVGRVLRADLGVADGYRYDPRSRLSCPITAFRGVDDPGVSPEAVQAWSVCTDGEFSRHDLPGDHTFLRSEVAPLTEIISAELRPAPRRSPGPVLAVRG